MVCHGFKGFRNWGFFPHAASRLALAGFTSVTFDFSGSGVGEDGESFDELDRWRRQTISGDLADLQTVVDWAVSQGAPWVGLLGHSRGGATALIHAAGDLRVKALVTWAAVCAYLRWPEDQVEQWRRLGSLEVVNLRTGQVLPVGLDLLDDLEAHRNGKLDVLAAAARIRVPWLIVHGTADETVPAEDGARLLAASRSGGGGARLLPVQGAGHTFGVGHPWTGSGPAFDLVLDRTVALFSAALA